MSLDPTIIRQIVRDEIREVLAQEVVQFPFELIQDRNVGNEAKKGVNGEAIDVEQGPFQEGIFENAKAWDMDIEYDSGSGDFELTFTNLYDKDGGTTSKIADQTLTIPSATSGTIYIAEKYNMALRWSAGTDSEFIYATSLGGATETGIPPDDEIYTYTLLYVMTRYGDSWTVVDVRHLMKRVLSG